MTQIKWKTKVEYYDTDNGLQLTELEAKTNYITIKTEKNVYIQNGNGTITHTKQCKRIYESNLFGNPNK